MHREPAKRCAPVLDRHILREDKLAERPCRGWRDHPIQIDDAPRFGLDEPQVRVDAPLAAEPERTRSAPRRERLATHILREHALEEIEPVASPDFQRAAVGEVDQHAPLPDRGVLRLQLPERRDDLHTLAARVAPVRSPRGAPEADERGLRLEMPRAERVATASRLICPPLCPR